MRKKYAKIIRCAIKDARKDFNQYPALSPFFKLGVSLNTNLQADLYMRAYQHTLDRIILNKDRAFLESYHANRDRNFRGYGSRTGRASEHDEPR